ncbi:hypothetical protein C1646_496575 [Rhizophagus diaphanus]|nr:hypothetical protein C1646_496575 [Rhizophagus diaphanus] [Rhizophagus sp. MUCL 43196]
MKFLISIGSLSTFSMTSNSFITDSTNTCTGKLRKEGFVIRLDILKKFNFIYNKLYIHYYLNTQLIIPVASPNLYNQITMISSDSSDHKIRLTKSILTSPLDITTFVP